MKSGLLLRAHKLKLSVLVLSLGVLAHVPIAHAMQRDGSDGEERERSATSASFASASTDTPLARAQARWAAEDRARKDKDRAERLQRLELDRIEQEKRAHQFRVDQVKRPIEREMASARDLSLREQNTYMLQRAWTGVADAQKVVDAAMARFSEVPAGSASAAVWGDPIESARSAMADQEKALKKEVKKWAKRLNFATAEALAQKLQESSLPGACKAHVMEYLTRKRTKAMAFYESLDGDSLLAYSTHALRKERAAEFARAQKALDAAQAAFSNPEFTKATGIFVLVERHPLVQMLDKEKTLVEAQKSLAAQGKYVADKVQTTLSSALDEALSWMDPAVRLERINAAQPGTEKILQLDAVIGEALKKAQEIQREEVLAYARLSDRVEAIGSKLIPACLTVSERHGLQRGLRELDGNGRLQWVTELLDRPEYTAVPEIEALFERIRPEIAKIEERKKQEADERARREERRQAELRRELNLLAIGRIMGGGKSTEGATQK